MKFKIIHDTRGRLRLRCGGGYFGRDREKSIEEYILAKSYVMSVKVTSVNGGIFITYRPGYRKELLDTVSGIRACDVKPRVVSNDYEGKFKKRLMKMLLRRFILRRFMPMPVRIIMSYIKVFPYIRRAVSSLLSFRLDVSLLDGAAVGAALARGMHSEVNSIIFLLKISELLEEYTRKRTKDALSESLALKIDKVWSVQDGTEKLIPMSEVKTDDHLVFRDGSMIAVDGTVVSGEAMVNESSMTGEPQAARKLAGATVYAGTVIEEGSVVVRVSSAAGNTKISNIVNMIESGESLKAGVQTRAERLADSFVPYTLGLSVLVYLITRNVAKALSVLMVDYSCAIKLSTPISVISAMREASGMGFLVKGGKHLESFAHADTIVFDKTGTLTNACPVVEKILPFGGYTAEEVLKISACLEEHFPHSVAKAIVRAAQEKDLKHEEEHAEVEYIVAHGIATQLHGERTIIGSEHFVAEDEGVMISDAEKELIASECEGLSAIYLAIGKQLAGVICISDPPRAEAAEAVRMLKAKGVKDVIMLTGDHAAAARRTAEMLGIDNFRSQVLPEDKVQIIDAFKKQGRTVIMVGDGINDSPALAVSDVSVAMKDSSDLAREVADITLMSGDLRDLAMLRMLSERLFRRIRRNYAVIMAFNSALILLGLCGVITPSVSSLLHNSSTMLISANSMRPMLERDPSLRNT